MTPDPQLIVGSVREAWTKARADGKVTWSEFGQIAQICAEKAIEVARQQVSWTGAQKLAYAAKLALYAALWFAPGWGGQAAALLVKLGPGFNILLSVMQALVQSAYKLQQVEAAVSNTIGTGEP